MSETPIGEEERETLHNQQAQVQAACLENPMVSLKLYDTRSKV